MKTKTRVRLNMVVDGEPAEWLSEWKQRGRIYEAGGDDGVQSNDQVLGHQAGGAGKAA